MNRHIDTDTKRVGAADHWQQSLLGELLHQTTIAGEHAGMVDADAGTQQTLQDLAERGGELRALDGFRDRGALLLAGHARAGQRVGGLQRGILREMHHVNRRLALAERQFHRLLQRARVCIRTLNGTGRGASAMISTSVSVMSSSLSAIASTLPSVALINRNCVSGSVSSGTCQAQPRSGSP